MMKMNLEAMALTYAKDKGLLPGRQNGPTTAETLPMVRAYKISSDSYGKTIAQRTSELGEVEGVILKLRRNGELLDPEPTLELQEGDVLSVIASLQAHQWVQQHIGGTEILDTDLLDYQVVSKEIVVLNAHMLGKTIKDLELPSKFGCFTIGLNRSGIHLPATDEVTLNKGEVVQ